MIILLTRWIVGAGVFLVLLGTGCAPTDPEELVHRAKAALEQESHERAASLLHEAAAAGSVEAQSMLGVLYAQGKGVDKDYDEAMKWNKLASDNGDAGAMLRVGSAYVLGIGVPRDLIEGKRLMTAAAEAGAVEAAAQLGTSYLLGGFGFTQDYVAAEHWFGMAAKKGDASSAIFLGQMHAYGRSAKADGAEALKWYQLAAKLGNASAYRRIGDLYAHGGPNFSEDPVLAHAWYNRAQSVTADVKEMAQVADSLTQLEMHMTAEELRRAQRLAQQMNQNGAGR